MDVNQAIALLARLLFVDFFFFFVLSFLFFICYLSLFVVSFNRFHVLFLLASSTTSSGLINSFAKESAALRAMYSSLHNWRHEEIPRKVVVVVVVGGVMRILI